MSVRFELRERGVYDRETECVITTADTAEWTEYQASLQRGEHPDPIPRSITLATERVNRRLEVNNQRRRALAAGVSFNGHVFQSDPASRAAVARWAAVEPLPVNFAWRDAANVDVPMSKADMKHLATAMLEHERAVLRTSWELKRLIEKSDNPSNVGIDKWPQ